MYTPHGGRVLEDNIEALETVRNIRAEGRTAGAVDFCVGGDINIELKQGDTSEDLEGLDSIERYVMYGPDCRGGGEDVITCEKEVRCLQLLKEFSCTVTSTWTNNEDDGECRTWRAWGSVSEEAT